MPSLYLVATPIGNLEDITTRALRVLREAALIAAEDTRHTRKLLSRYAIEGHVIAYHEHNKLARLDTIMLALANGGDVALVSDAGTPAISDPGFELVQAVIAAGFPVVPVPGPCAAIAGLVGSGLPTDRFYYLGFPPRRSSERRTWLGEVAAIPATLVVYESPHRLVATLEDALAVLGNRPAAVARELTKLHEQFVRGTLREIQAHFAGQEVRGEIVLLIAGAERPSGRRVARSIADSAPVDAASPSEEAPVDAASIRARLGELRAQGLSGTHAAKQVARDLGLDRQEVYRLWTTLEDGS
ncbi:MAG: 16S rRNA (cytidine(1402)-2'-O)-methyltransferase [Herpetosiphonaceae bacterium]|nr:16S rRNA (cytidine(1402)-2'-O)-methyltransferase [Herpetosiphonaceae bacterium]